MDPVAQDVDMEDGSSMLQADDVEPEAEAEAEATQDVEISGIEMPRKKVVNGDLRKLFAASNTGSRCQPAQRDPIPQVSQTPIAAVQSSDEQLVGGGIRAGAVLLSAFKLSVSQWQDVSEAGLAAPLESQDESSTRLEKAVMVAHIPLKNLREAVPLLEAAIPLLPSGNAIFKQLPERWLDVSGRNDALGTRCLFASRRHEHSVFEPIPVEKLLQVPAAAREWSLPISVPADAAASATALEEEEPWTIQVHPGSYAARVLVRPGVLLINMIRRGTALPAARFAWRVTDTQASSEETSWSAARPLATCVGEFSILSNLEDAACTQPPHFQQYPLRREQLRSLGWMLAQERRRREPFVAELRASAPCEDAPHWRLQGSLRCEYTSVKGGVLADAIGYGKTACTIGLIDCMRQEALPKVPSSFRGFIPSRATLVLAPTNLHAQWLAEITKFTGDELKVLSVPTCTQLKRLSLKDLVEADVVVATYRLFYSSPYLRRLEELAREKRSGFSFPRHSQNVQAVSADWAKSYRTAFEALPFWAARILGHRALEEEPVTPARSLLESKAKKAACEERETPAEDPTTIGPQAKRRRCSSKAASTPSKVTDSHTVEEDTVLTSTQRRRLVGKQASSLYRDDLASESSSWPAAASSTQFIPLEVFWWRRVVCDEFHELLSRYPPAQVAVELFHADYKWGLSGTPPCQTLAQIRKAAGFLGVQLPSAESVDKDEPRKVAQEWLDAFVRRNTAELPPLDEEERIVPVRQTPKERALYEAITEQHRICHEGTEEVPKEVVEVPPELQGANRTASGLLKLCSHFCASGATDVVTAEDECERQLALRRDQAKTAELEVHSLAERVVSTAQMVRHFQPFFGIARINASNCCHISKEPKAAIVARLKFLGASTLGSKGEILERLYEAATSATHAVKEKALAYKFIAKAAGKASHVQVDGEEAGGKHPAWLTLSEQLEAAGSQQELSAGQKVVLDAIKKAVAACAADPPSRCTRLRSSLGMPKWPGSQDLGTDRREELEDANEAWLKDRANADKLNKVIHAWKVDIQRSALRLLALQSEVGDKLRNLRSFQESLYASQLAAAPEEVALEQSRVSHFAKYGSKIEAIVRHVQKIQKDDPDCKIICFVQWEDLKRKISSALQEFEVQHLTLQGSVWARRSALMQFQYEADSPRMLLLSLEESASGTNLTAANHVIIVHPMEAATREEAVAFEMQAVGRVRRPGQSRKIYIWRFVTVGTIEQQITEEHQRELWERQRAKILVADSASLPAAQDEESDIEALEVDPQKDKAAVTYADSSTQRYLGEGCLDSFRDCAQDIATQCYVPAVGSRAEEQEDSQENKSLDVVHQGCQDDNDDFLDENTETIPHDFTGNASTLNYVDVNATQCYRS